MNENEKTHYEFSYTAQSNQSEYNFFPGRILLQTKGARISIDIFTEVTKHNWNMKEGVKQEEKKTDFIMRF